MNNKENRKLSTILAMDIIGYSSKIADNDEDTLKLLAERRLTFLTTTYILRIIFNINVSKVSLIISFVSSMCGSILYYLESQKINTF